MAALVGLAVLAGGCANARPTASPTTADTGRLPPTAPSTESTTVRTPPSASPTTTTAVVTTTSSTGLAAGAPCADGQLSVSAGANAYGLGHVGVVLRFVNVSSSTCSLSGYPGVAALDAQGAQVQQAVRQPDGYLGGVETGTHIPPTVSLAPGAAASAVVEGTDNPTEASGTPSDSAPTCPYYPDFLVTAPGLTVSVKLAVGVTGGQTPGFPGCSPLQVHPVVPGASGVQY